MATAPSVSYSITVRLEVPASGSAVSQLTTAVESSGGAVHGLDVTASGHEKLRIDVTIAASSTEHAAEIVEKLRGIEDIVVDKVSDRTFLMHLGGKIEMQSKHPIRNRDDLSMIYTPGVARVCMAIADNPEDAHAAHHQAQQRRGRHRRLGRPGPGQHRADGRAARHGGQGGAVQAVRRDRRVAAVPGHPGQRRDRGDRQGDRPRVRGHQPGGHLGAAVLRDRGAAARGPGHPGVPRRPARHRDRGAGGADQRAAGRGQEDR